MKRKNKDWVIVLEDGCTKKIAKLFFKEVELKPFNKETINISNIWAYYESGFEAIVAKGVDFDGKSFTIPSQWKQAKEYILEEEHILPDTGWVKCDNVIIYRTGKDSGYGIDRWGEWGNDDTWSFVCNPESWQIATHEEVKEALIKQAERIGYKVGDRIKVPWCDATRVIEDDDNCDLFEYDGDNLIYCKNELLMSDGQWAEIIKEEPKELVIDCKNAEHCEIDRKLIFHNYLSLNTEFYLSHKDSETIKGIIKKENYEIIIREKS